MPRVCEPLYDADGNVVGWVTRFVDSIDVKCSSCGTHTRDPVLCDYPVKSKSGTCDRRCCRKCATRVGPNRDYCPAHARVAGASK